MPNAKIDFYKQSAAIVRQHADADKVGQAHMALAATFAVNAAAAVTAQQSPELREIAPQLRQRPKR